MTDSYSVSLKKAVHVFSAGHFITLTDDICEAVHGHNWTVACSVSGVPGNHGMVIDFIFLRDTLSKITSQLDHCMLLPTENTFLQVLNFFSPRDLDAEFIFVLFCGRRKKTSVDRSDAPYESRWRSPDPIGHRRGRAAACTFGRSTFHCHFEKIN